MNAPAIGPKRLGSLVLEAHRSGLTKKLGSSDHGHMVALDTDLAVVFGWGRALLGNATHATAIGFQHMGFLVLGAHRSGPDKKTWSSRSRVHGGPNH